MTWNQLVRGKFGASLADQRQRRHQSDCDATQRKANASATSTRSIRCRVWRRAASRRPSAGQAPGSRGAAQPFCILHSRASDGARLRDVAVREPVTRSSADLPAQLRELLAKIEVGHLTAPEMTPQGTADVRALRQARRATPTSPAKKRGARTDFRQGSRPKSKRYLEEIRKQAMIEYKIQMSDAAALPLALTLGEPAGIGPDLTLGGLAPPRASSTCRLSTSSAIRIFCASARARSASTFRSRAATPRQAAARLSTRPAGRAARRPRHRRARPARRQQRAGGDRLDRPRRRRRARRPGRRRRHQSDRQERALPRRLRRARATPNISRGLPSEATGKPGRCR